MEQENSKNGGTRMRKVILEEQVKLTGVKNFTGKDKLIDFYIEQPGDYFAPAAPPIRG